MLAMTRRFESMIHPRTAEPDLGGRDAPIPEGKLGVGEFVAHMVLWFMFFVDIKF